jgi:hypothetical protein
VWLDTGLLARLEEELKAFVPERSYHGKSVSRIDTGVNRHATCTCR